VNFDSSDLLASGIAKSFEEREHRAMIGFSINTALFAVVERRQLSKRLHRHSQTLNIYCPTMGSTIDA
jgi:hypothetical protein